jgi:benzil reductase ((S)-benzoin forming)
MATIFITGNSNGLGLGLTRYYLQQDANIYSISRSPCPIDNPRLHQRQLDLSDLDSIPSALQSLLPKQLDLVILNAGILGAIQDLADTDLQQVRQVMDINVWANKIIIDSLIKQGIQVRQLILISSGASVNGNRGWGIYSISKASVNMMAKLYATEMPDTHITAYAPGLVQTDMQEYLCHQVDTAKFPSIQRLVDAYHTDDMPDIDSAAQKIALSFPRCLDYPSGSFLDIRQL